MISRRQMIGTGLAALTVTYIGRSDPIKSMLGAKEIDDGENKWENPYITDGLVAHWDGEWNSVGGVHDASATTWVDLSGNGHDITSPYFQWIDDALDDTASNIRIDLGDLVCNSGITIEAVVRCPNMRNNSYIFDFYNHSNLGMTLACTNLVSPYGLRGYVRNENNQKYSNYLPCDEGYFITSTLSWNETGCQSYFFGIPSTFMQVQFSQPLVYYFLGASNSSLQNFRGYVHCSRVYNRALTAQEVAYNYSVDIERFNLT